MVKYGWLAMAFEVEEERYCLVATNVELLFESGTNGLNGTRTDVAELLGYSNLRDLNGAAGYTVSTRSCPIPRRGVMAHGRGRRSGS